MRGLVSHVLIYSYKAAFTVKCGAFVMYRVRAVQLSSSVGLQDSPITMEIQLCDSFLLRI